VYSDSASGTDAEGQQLTRGYSAPIAGREKPASQSPHRRPSGKRGHVTVGESRGEIATDDVIDNDVNVRRLELLRVSYL